MPSRLQGNALENIPYGSLVLCRGNEVRLAPPELANGRARPDKFGESRGRSAYRKGEWVEVEPIDGLGDRCLHAMAAGPIMEPLRLYLPAGTLTEAEYQERLALDFERAGISRK